MKILLLTDTHNELEIINQLAESEQVDACIHCGDFGFYDEQSIERLTQRELQLRIRHSHLPRDIRKKSYNLSHEDAQQVLKEHQLLEGFFPYLRKEKTFSVPVYTVWGNHDDHVTIRKLLSGEFDVPNLHLLHESNEISLPEAGLRLIGLGGNFYLEGRDLFAPGFTGTGGKVRASWLQYARLLENELKRRQSGAQLDEVTAFVSHVSPGKSECQLLERLCLVMGVEMSLSGHMDPPIHHAYSLFTMCEPEQALARSQPIFDALCKRWEDERETSDLSDEQRQLVDRSLETLNVPHMKPAERGKRAKKGSIEDRFYTTQFINLADAPEGWAVMELEDGHMTLKSRSRWKLR